MASPGVLCTVGTYVLTEPVSCTINIEGAELDSTHLGAAGMWGTSISGVQRWTVDVEGDWVLADLTAALLIFKPVAGPGQACQTTAINVHLMECDGTTHGHFTGNAMVKNVKVGASVKDKTSMSVSFVGVGAPAFP